MVSSRIFYLNTLAYFQSCRQESEKASTYLDHLKMFFEIKNRLPTGNVFEHESRRDTCVDYSVDFYECDVIIEGV